MSVLSTAGRNRNDSVQAAHVCICGLPIRNSELLSWTSCTVPSVLSRSRLSICALQPFLTCPMASIVPAAWQARPSPAVNLGPAGDRLIFFVCITWCRFNKLELKINCVILKESHCTWAINYGMGGVVSAGQNNEELVDNLCQEGYIHEPRVEKVANRVLVWTLTTCRSKYLGWRVANICLANYIWGTFSLCLCGWFMKLWLWGGLLCI